MKNKGEFGLESVDGAGIRMSKEEKETLSEIINVLNNRFGMDKLIGRMDQNQDIFSKMMDDIDFGVLVKNYMMKKVYERLNK